jgi:hypothetical protein
LTFLQNHRLAQREGQRCVFTWHHHVLLERRRRSSTALELCYTLYFRIHKSHWGKRLTDGHPPCLLPGRPCRPCPRWGRTWLAWSYWQRACVCLPPPYSEHRPEMKRCFNDTFYIHSIKEHVS